MAEPSANTAPRPQLRTTTAIRSSMPHEMPHSNAGAPNQTSSGDENMMNGAATSGESASTGPLEGMVALGASSRKLIQTIRKLDALSIDSTVPSLPKFVVIGDQSAGKSSIVEALCEISLPRSHGTCTRCPFQITTSSSTEVWSCRVTLHAKYRYMANAKGKKAGEYDRWTEQPEVEQYLFATTDEPNQLGDILRRAQTAILCPNLPSVSLRNVSVGQLPAPTIGFSPNFVGLEISGPNLPELSIFDLPGAINVLGNEGEQHLVGFIEKLIKNYVKDEKTRVLLAVTSDQDAETSTAFRYLTECKALHRSMGVLTKPDLLDSSHRVQYIQPMLANEWFKLGDGWFVTKQSSQAELDSGIGHAEARDRERQFFESGPWAHELLSSSARFGIPELQSAVSDRLAKHIRSELPEIIARVETQLSIVDKELAQFPDQAQMPHFTVNAEIDKLSDMITREIRGEGLVNNFRNKYKNVLRKLRTDLKRVRPRVIFTTPGYQQPAYELDSSSDEENISEQTPSKSRKSNYGATIPTTPSNRRVKSEKPTSAAPTRPTPMPALVPGQSWAHKLDVVKQAYDQGSVSGISGQPNSKVTDDLISKSEHSWDKLVEDALDDVASTVVNMYTGCMTEVLATREQTQLRAETNRLLDELFSSVMDSQRGLIKIIVDSERHKPICYGTVNIEAVKKELETKRLEARVSEFFEMKESTTPNKITGPADRQKKASDSAWCAANIGPDKYSGEIAQLATVLAFYDVAFARMHDSIAVHLEYGLLHALATQLKHKLVVGLDAYSPGHCAWLLAEDPAREQERARFLTEKGKLEAALVELQSVAQQQ